MNKYFTTAIKFILILIFFTAINTKGQAQRFSDKIYTGFVVTIENDTIHGMIRMLTPALNEVRVKMESVKGEKLSFQANNLASYHFVVPKYDYKTKTRKKVWVHYFRKTVDKPAIAFASKEAMLERPVEGAINLYNFYMERAGNIDMPITHTFYIEQDNSNVLFELTLNNYRQMLQLMTAEHTELNKKIGKEGYRFKQIKKILEEYNIWAAANKIQEDLSFVSE